MSRKKVLKEDILKRLNKPYSFSKTDNFITREIINPVKFLETTYQEARLNHIKHGKEMKLDFKGYLMNDISGKHMKRLKRLLRGTMKNKYGGLNIPFLEFDEKGNPIGHEGRHTMMALQSLGINEVPVDIVKRKEAFLW